MPEKTTFVPDSPVATSTPARPPHVSVVQQNHSGLQNHGLVDIFHTFHNAIETQLNSVVSSLDRVTERITQLETLVLENEDKQASRKGDTTVSPRKPGRQQREVPAVLQVCISWYGDLLH